MNIFKTALSSLCLISSLIVYAQDCSDPPTCMENFTVQVFPPPGSGPCTAIVYAVNFITPDPAVCAPNFEFAIYRASEVEAAGSGFLPNPAQNYLIVNTQDGLIVPVYIYTFVNPTTYAACVSYIFIQDEGDCGGFGESISGVIATEEDETVENVEVNISGGIVSSLTTQADGSYYFGPLEIGFDYVITPYRNDNPGNGVSVADLILIGKHIIGLELLDSPYKMIAADVNQSGTISVLDIIQIRRLILNVYTELPESPSWRFVPANHVFLNPANPWQDFFPEAIIIDNLELDLFSLDFVAIKMGDVNGNAMAN